MSDPGLVSGCVVFLVLSALGSLLLGLDGRFRSTLRSQIGLYLAAFAVRFAMALAIEQGGVLGILKSEDARQWVKGVELHRGWVAEGFGLRQVPWLVGTLYENHHQGYYYLLGALFYATGPAQLPAAVFNGFLGALTVVFVFRIAATFFSRAVAVRVGWWLCLFPSLVIWSSQTIKEPVVLLLEVYAIYSFMVNRRESRPRYAIVTSLCCAVSLVPFRIYAAFAVLMSVTFTSILPAFRKSEGEHDLSHRVSLETAWLATAGVIWITALNRRYFEFMNLDFLLWLRSYNSRGGSGIPPPSHDLWTLGGFALNFLEGAIYLLLAPLPWDLAGGSRRMLLTTPEMIVWWWLFFAGVLPGLWYVLRTQWADFLPVFLLIAINVMFQAPVLGNTGHAFRQRAHLLVWLLMFAAVEWQRRSKAASARAASGPNRDSGQSVQTA